MDLAKEFEAALRESCRIAQRQIGYNPQRFLEMLDRDRAVLTAKYLINKEPPSEGYTYLWEKGRLDLSLEAVLIDNDRWHSLVDPSEIVKARRRLKAYQYTPKTE